jgi:hypothetical protein
MIDLIKVLATFCCGVFFGAALYISVVQHPAALETGNDFAARFFGPMYQRAAVLQASLALLGCATAIAAWLSGAGRLWLGTGILIGSVVPFTLIVSRPVKRQERKSTRAYARESGREMARLGATYGCTGTKSYEWRP